MSIVSNETMLLTSLSFYSLNSFFFPILGKVLGMLKVVACNFSRSGIKFAVVLIPNPISRA